MSLDNLPDVVCVHVIDFLLPCDVHALGTVCATYQSFIGRSLNNSLALVLKNSNINFKCLDPLHSFTSLTRLIPAPRSVCIRWVYTTNCSVAVCFGARLTYKLCFVVVAILFFTSQWKCWCSGCHWFNMEWCWLRYLLYFYCGSIRSALVDRQRAEPGLWWIFRGEL